LDTAFSYEKAYETILTLTLTKQALKLMWSLQEANPDAKFFVMSATAEMGHPEDAIEAGAAGVIDKLASFERAFAAMRGHGSG
jgi:DNA-binding NarL/FixJ family response regulator